MANRSVGPRLISALLHIYLIVNSQRCSLFLLIVLISPTILTLLTTRQFPFLFPLSPSSHTPYIPRIRTNPTLVVRAALQSLPYLVQLDPSRRLSAIRPNIAW